MSIVLKDGTVLPDLPEGLITEECPYSCITYNNDVGFYYAHSSGANFIYIPAGVIPFAEEPILLTMTTNVMTCTLYNGEWLGPSTNDVIPNGGFSLDKNVIEWSNHDILEVVSVNLETEELTYADEPYFPNSLVKPPFVLPDGTELPALPDGCFDGTPYGMIIGIDWAGNGQMMYSMQATSTPIVALPAELVPEDSGIQPGDGITHMIMMQPGTGKAYMVDGEAWTAPESGGVSEPVVSFGIGVVLWANHDLNEVSTLNADDMSYTIGTEIARKSDENYRVTGGYMTSIANEARRLGGKTGGMLPAVAEATLRGVTAGGGGTQLAPNERIYQVGSGNSTIRSIVFSSSTQ